MDVFQKRGEKNVFYVPNESEPYTGWAKGMYRNSTQVEILGQNGERTGRRVDENGQNGRGDGSGGMRVAR